MALKPDRVESFTDVSFFMNTTGDRGGVVVYNGNGGVGSSMDDADAVVIYPTGSPSGTAPAGVLLNDVVNLDLTRQHINYHKDEVQKPVARWLLLRSGSSYYRLSYCWVQHAAGWCLAAYVGCCW